MLEHRKPGYANRNPSACDTHLPPLTFWPLLQNFLFVPGHLSTWSGSWERKKDYRFCIYGSPLRIHIWWCFLYSPLKTCRLQKLQPQWRREASVWTRSPCCCWIWTCRSSALAPSASSSAASSRGSEMNWGNSCWWADLSLHLGPDLLLQNTTSRTTSGTGGQVAVKNWAPLCGIQRLFHQQQDQELNQACLNQDLGGEILFPKGGLNKFFFRLDQCQSSISNCLAGKSSTIKFYCDLAVVLGPNTGFDKDVSLPTSPWRKSVHETTGRLPFWQCSLRLFLFNFQYNEISLQTPSLLITESTIRNIPSLMFEEARSVNTKLERFISFISHVVSLV